MVAWGVLIMELEKFDIVRKVIQRLRDPRGATRLLFERLTGTRVVRGISRGTFLFDDLQILLPRLQVKTVFDVGANTGQSAKIYLKKFSGATIYCFEPVEKTFRELQRNVPDHDTIKCFKLALSSTRGTGKFVGGKLGYVFSAWRGAGR